MVAPRKKLVLDRAEPCIGLPQLEETSHGSCNNNNNNNNATKEQQEISPNGGVVIHNTSNNQRDAQDSRYPETSPAAPMTIPSSSPKDIDLEDRVQELEDKLATLSLLLQRQNHQLRSIRPQPSSITPPASPPRDDDSDRERDHERDRDGVTPYLESPAPHRPMRMSMDQQRRRDLSFRVLHGDETSKHGTDHAADSIFLPDESLPASPENLYAVHTAHEAVSPIFQTTTSTLEQDTHTLPSAVYDESFLSTPMLYTSTQKKEKADVKSKWLDYLNSFQESDYDTDKQMEEFVKVPSAVEALLSFGFWICVDSFLYILTILPIRFIWSSLLLLRFLLIRMFNPKVPEGPFRFHRRHSYQLIQVSIIYTIYKYVLMPISIGKFYHWIRGQAMVKLYVLIAMVEIFDRLMCSLGQDCLDSLYWNATRRPRSSRLIVSVIVVLTYTMVHSFLLFVHVATLNVAMNSDDSALISLLIGGNFAEIKSTVFKKYNKANLFKIAASDICERFKLALFLALVLALNMSQGMDEKMVMNYIHMCGVVWCAEWLADWIKHSFITKFNFISSGMYPEYGLLLAGDVTGIGHEGVNLDHSHAVVKRIGFAQLPLVCVFARYLHEAFKYATYESQPSKGMIGVGLFAVWSVLLVCKLFLGSFLQRISHAKLKAAPEFSAKNHKLEKKRN